jgi:MoxR-like ATPase
MEENQENNTHEQGEANTNPEFQSGIDLSELKAAADDLKNEIKKVIVGQEEMVDLILIALLSDGHVLIEGMPGVAKTLLAKVVAKCISVNFSRIQFTPDLMPSDVTGTFVFNQKTGDFDFRKGPIFSNFVLIDEINRSPAKTQSSLFEVMEERQITADGNCFKMDYPFIVLATQNPVEHEGTYRLPEAQLDRFLFKIEVDYPALEEEILILESHNLDTRDNLLNKVSPILTASKIKEYRDKVSQVFIEKNMIAYIAKIVTGTRNNNALYVGASPRASIALMNASKALAAISGRDFVTPDDIRYLAPIVMKHRVVLSPEREIEGILAEDIIAQIIKNIEIPR